MRDTERYPIEFQSIAFNAARCSDCFVDSNLQRSLVDRAQPRWIGPNYLNSTARIIFMMLNPGGGENRRDTADAHLRNLLHRFASGEDILDEIMNHQRADFPNWGGGRFVRFLDLAGLDLENIALMNIAWCATSKNKYPKAMLRSCFRMHTEKALSSLKPDVVILSGTAIHNFGRDVRAALPDAKVIKTLHYAHRKGSQSTESAAEDLKMAIKSV